MNVVCDCQDIADGVVGVSEVLQSLTINIYSQNPRKTKILLIVCVLCRGAVAVNNFCHLALGVVLNV